jgi:hypothetical protein
VYENDIICFNECWVKCPKDFELNDYETKYVSREKCNGGGVIAFYKKNG